MEGGYIYLWEYRVLPGARAEFERRYGATGEWVRLFKRGTGHLETLLLKDRHDVDRYITVDRWESEAAFRQFREQFAVEFETLDRECDPLTVTETPLGTFQEVML